MRKDRASGACRGMAEQEAAFKITLSTGTQAAEEEQKQNALPIDGKQPTTHHHLDELIP